MEQAQLTKILNTSIEEHAFSGVISIRRQGTALYERAASYADRSNRIANTLATRFGIASGTLGLTLQGRGLPSGWRAGQERQLSTDRPMPPVNPGTRMTLRNAGDAPLDLYRLEFLPEPPGTPDTSALSG